MKSPGEAARAFVDAMNAYDHPALAKLLADDVELRGFKKIYEGRESTAEWLGTPGPNLKSRIEITDLRETENRALVVADRHWIWVESRDEAEVELWHAVWWVEDGVIAAWQPFHFLPEAIEAFETD